MKHAYINSEIQSDSDLFFFFSNFCYYGYIRYIFSMTAEEVCNRL